MPTFQYQGRDQAGKATRGVIDAADTGAAASRLIGMGVTPIRIEIGKRTDNPDKKASGLQSDIRLPFMDRFRKVDIDEMIIFCRQMYTLTKSGVPINRSVRGIATMTENTLLAETLEAVAQDVEAGHQLGICLGRQPEVFNTMFVNIVLSGESSGNLEAAFQQLASHLELERETIRRIKSATRYPTFVLLAMGVAITILTMFVIPVFEQVFASFGGNLPWQTQALLGVSRFAVNWWWLIVGVGVVGWVLISRYLATDEGQYRWGRRKLKLPVIGEIYERIALGRFAAIFAMLLRAGVPITSAIRTVGDAVGNRFIGEHVKSMASGIERGEMLTRTATESGLFTPLVLQMMAVGEETGSVDSLLDEVAEFYEQEVDYKLKRLVDAIEPIMALGLGVLVLIMALGIFLPLWDLSSTAR